MKREEYARMFDLEDRYWWFRGRRELARSLLSRYRVWCTGDRILDVGCGTGATLVVLSSLGTVVGLDASREALQFCRRRDNLSLVRARAGQIPFSDSTFHGVVALDVLEHVPDDGRVLEEIQRVVCPGGLVVVTVPAFRFLWSQHDGALHHYRRYRAWEVGERMERAGLRVRKLSYAVTTLFLPIALYRLGERIARPRTELQTTLKSVPGVVNSMLYGLLWLEARWIRVAKFPFGVSIVGVGQKPGEGR